MAGPARYTTSVNVSDHGVPSMNQRAASVPIDAVAGCELPGGVRDKPTPPVRREGPARGRGGEPSGRRPAYQEYPSRV